ncbi:replication protein P [Limnohabitans sp. T6-5]|uniref:replication protein P n=1 Tax=Limnohabitans sp. T6-5 TaxID=1100724 RepID=UPI0011B27615|nr:replication protein P [Limnohabitans sp. T6-5]
MSLTCQRNTWLDARHIRGRLMSPMDHLFNRLDGMYPNRWRASFPSEASIVNWREAWADAFVDAQLTPQHIAVGIRACARLFDWPPSITEFIRACSPQLDAEAAFTEACTQMRLRDDGRDKWSHKAVYWAAVDFGTWDLRNSSWSAAKTRWSRILAEKMSTPNLPEPPPRRDALPAPGQGSADPQKVRQLIADLKAKLAGKAEIVPESVKP